MKMPGWTKSFSRPLRELRENPLAVSSALSLVSPRLGQQFLSYVSEFTRPHELGMGMRLVEFSEERLEVSLPRRWRNHNERGELHVGSIVTAAEHVGQVFWQHHLDRTYSSFELVRIDANLLRRTNQSVIARLDVREAERESMLFDLRRAGVSEATLTMRFFAHGEQLVTEVTTVWRLNQAPVLPAAPVL